MLEAELEGSFYGNSISWQIIWYQELPDIDKQSPRILIRELPRQHVSIVLFIFQMVFLFLTMQNVRCFIQSKGWFSILGLGSIFPFYDTGNTSSPQPSISLIQGFSFNGQRGVSVSEEWRSKSWERQRDSYLFYY